MGGVGVGPSVDAHPQGGQGQVDAFCLRCSQTYTNIVQFLNCANAVCLGMMEDRLNIALHDLLGCCCRLCGVCYQAHVLFAPANILGTAQVLVGIFKFHCMQQKLAAHRLLENLHHVALQHVHSAETHFTVPRRF